MPEKKNGAWKYCYWLDGSALAELQRELAKHNITMTRAQNNPCEALRGEAGYAEPATWDVICKHDAAPWYRASPHAGEILAVTSFPLGKQYEPFLETTIETSDFEPIDFPPRESCLNWPIIQGSSPAFLKDGAHSRGKWVRPLSKV